MNELRRFPILTTYDERRRHPDWPQSVPWSLVAPHEAQAKANHYQTLERLAERGGLSPLEMLAVITDRDYDEVSKLDPDEAVTLIMRQGGLERAAK